MAIQKKSMKVRALHDTQHDGIGVSVTVPDAEQDLENNQSADRLVDLEDLEGMGSTHTSVTAKSAASKVVAEEGLQPTDEQNVGTLDNDCNPAEGYLPGEVSVSEPVGEMQADATSTNVDNLEPVGTDLTPEDLPVVLDNSEAADPIEANDDAGDDIDEAGDDESDNDNFDNDTDLEDDAADDTEWDPAPAGDDMLDSDLEADEEMDEDDDISDDDVVADLEEDVVDNSAVPPGESMSILDVDQTPDTDDDVVFAQAGTIIHAIKANRIIASIGKRQAVKAGVEDVYLKDQFTDVVAAEIQSKGLRKGLTDTGFVLASIKVGSQVVAALVEKEVHKTTAAIRQVSKDKEETMEQAMAIAAVGLARHYFKGYENPLKAALVQQLTMAGLRNPARILNQVFASEGVEYSKELLKLAAKLASVPQEVRDGFAEGLNMTSANADFEDLEEDNTEDGVDDFEELEDDGMDSSSVEATLLTAGFTSRQSKAALLTRPGLSVTASDLLNGKTPLF